MAMRDFFELKEDPKPWRAMREWVGALALGLLALLALEAVDRLEASTPGYAAERVWAESVGDRAWLEREALALRDFAERETGIGLMSWVGVSLGDDLERQGSNGRFNPSTLRLTLSRELLGAPPHEGRWVALHELGHAAALLTFRSEPYAENLGLPEGALRAARESPLYRKAYEESFSDVFAYALSRRLQRSDPVARKEALRAFYPHPTSVSIAHDTAPALREAARRSEELESARGRELLGLIDGIASRGALRQVALWGAEREALCAAGAWGWAKSLRQGSSYWVADPRRLAEASWSEGEPMGEDLAALASFREEGVASRRAWAEAALRGGASGEDLLAGRAGSPRGAGSSSASRWGVDEEAAALFRKALERVEFQRGSGAFGEAFAGAIEAGASWWGPERPRGCL